MMNWRQSAAVERDSQCVSAAWVFSHARAPLLALVESFEDGASVDVFEWFPGVQRTQIEAAIEVASSSVLVPSAPQR